MRRFALLLLVLCLATPAVAQNTPSFDVSGGYSFLRDQYVEENFHGWLASITWNVNPILGITGEAGGNYRTLEVFGTDVSLSVHSFMTGPRFASRANQNVTPFFHLLAGVVRGRASALGESASLTDFALQPGGGVDFWIGRRVGIRVGADYRRVFVDDEGSNEFRFHVGIALRGPVR